MFCYNRRSENKGGIGMTSQDIKDAKEKAMCRLRELLSLQERVEEEFGDSTGF